MEPVPVWTREVEDTVSVAASRLGEGPAIDDAGARALDLTRFIGRRRELALVRAALERSRLVTLTGPGGVGKTRVALRLADELGRAFRDGVRVVALADVQDPALLGHTVNTAVGIRETSARWHLETLVEHLHDRQLLLVLDNCEHLVDATANLADALLRRCSGLTILATSRQSLNIDGEAAVPIPPMPIPDVERGTRRAEIEQSEAVSLFVDRAASAVPGFTLTKDNEAQVAQLCRLLEGIPLAIELAAVRLRVLPLGELLERMDDRYRLLSHGSRTAPARHQTLRASIEWTYDLCSPAEQLLWRRLSVFAGGFGLEAAEAVSSGGDIDRSEVLDLVTDLVDKSILTRVMESRAPRYQMLETIRHYGVERLSGPESRELAQLHRTWFIDLAERANTDWSGPRQVEWLEQLRWEHANLRAALHSCLAEDPQGGMRLCWSIENMWLARGFLSEARHWLDQLLAVAPDPTLDRGRSLRLSAWLAILQGDYDVVPGLLDEAERLAEHTGDALLAVYVRQTRGLDAEFRGSLAEAVERLEPAVADFARLGHKTGEIQSLFEVGLSLGFAGEYERAAAWHMRCQQVAAEIGESFWRSYSLWALGIEKWRQGDSVAAGDLQRESLRLKRQLDDLLGIGCCLEAMSWIAAADGDGERAARLLGSADAVLRTAGMPLENIKPMWAYHVQGEGEAKVRATERVFRSAYAAGAAMPVAAAVAYALDELTMVPSEEAFDARDGLTRREREVSELVAEGLTNRQIAARLVISVRTAEKHLDNIMTKLDATNRTQIAARVVRAPRRNTNERSWPTR